MSRCPNCMNELVHDRCTCCGYPAVEVAAVRGALPPETVLMNRFELGYALGASQQSIAYVAYDRSQGKAVLILEFCPKQIAVRKKLQIAPRSHNELYMDACRRFLTSEQSMPMQLIHTFAENNTAYRVYQLNGNAANVVDEADQMLDRPILFRNAEGKPVMAVNALPIPAMPQTTEWSLSRKLTKERNRKKVNTLAVAALVGILAIGAGVVYLDSIREYDVTVRVSTSSAIERASLGDQEWQAAATPDDNGVVTYQTSLRKGEYVFNAENEVQMSPAPLTITVGKGANEFEVKIPDPTLPPYTEKDFDWAYRIGDETYIIRDGAETKVSADRPLDTPVKLSKVTVDITGHEMLDAESMDLIFLRDDVERTLRWKEGDATIYVTDGEYALQLRTDDFTHLLPLTVSGDTSTQLNMKAYQHYAEYLNDKDGLYYIGEEPSIKNFLPTAKEVNEWVEMDEPLFGAFRQYEVSFELDGAPEGVTVLLNGKAWKPGTKTTFSAGETMVTATFSIGEQTLSDAQVTVAPVEGKENRYVLRVNTEEFAKWQNVDRMMQHDGKNYIIDYGKKKELDDAEWAKLQQAMVNYAKQLQFDDTASLTLQIRRHNKQMDAIDSVKLRLNPVEGAENDDIELTGDLDPLKMVYQIPTLTVGSYEVTVYFKDGTKTTETVEVSAQGNEYLLLDAESERAKTVFDAFGATGPVIAKTQSGSIFLNEHSFEDDGGEPVTPELLQAYAARYTDVKLAELCDVEIMLDERINVNNVGGNVVISGEKFKIDAASRKVDIEKLTAGVYEVEIDVFNQEDPVVYLLVVDASGTQLILLEDIAQAACDKLHFMGESKESAKLVSGNTFLLTEDAVEECRAKVKELKIYIPEQWREVKFVLRGADNKRINLTPDAESGLMTAYATPGAEYELCAVSELDVPVSFYDGTMSAGSTLTMETMERALRDNDQTKKMMAGIEDFQMEIDERINAKDHVTHVGFKDSSIVLERIEDHICSADDAVECGDYVVHVMLNTAEGMKDIYYSLTLNEEGEYVLKNSAGDVVEKLLSDVADEAIKSLRYFGESRGKLVRIGGDESLLTPETIEACKAAVPGITLTFPAYYPLYNMTFKLSPVGRPEHVISMGKETYMKKAVENRYKTMYLSEGEYELTVEYRYDQKDQKKILGKLIVGDELSVKVEKAGVIDVDKKKENTFKVIDDYDKVLSIGGKPQTRTAPPTYTPVPTPDTNGGGSSTDDPEASSSVDPDVLLSPDPTQSSEPTDREEPTATPTATSTATSTATPTATPAATPTTEPKVN